MNQDLVQKQDTGVAKSGNMIKLRDILSEDLFGTSLKLKPYEALMVKSVVSFMMDKYKFKAKIIVKKKDKAGMIGDISLNSNSVDNNKFYLHFNPNQSYKRIIQSMIHELTHVKQVSKSELLPNKEYTSILWKGKEYITAKEYGKLMKSDINSYMKLPWEIEADMNSRNSISKKNGEELEPDNKTRKKREELSVSACKTIKKESVKIVVKFN